MRKSAGIIKRLTGILIILLVCGLSGAFGDTEQEQKRAEAETESSGELLLKAVFEGQDEEDEETESSESEDLSFLDEVFPDQTEKQEDGTDREPAKELSAEELDRLVVSQLQDALNDPEKQRSIDMSVFLSENTRRDRNCVYTYPVPESMVVQSAQAVPRTETEISSVIEYGDPGGRSRMVSTVLMRKTDQYSRSMNDPRDLFPSPSDDGSIILENREIYGKDDFPRYLITGISYRIDPDTLLIQMTCRVSLMYMHDSNTAICIDYLMTSEPGTVFSGLPTEEDLLTLFSGIAYQIPEDRSAAGIPDWLLTDADFTFRISAQPETSFLGSGQTVRLTAEYERSDLSERVKQTAGFTYIAADPDQLSRGNLIPVNSSVATMDAKGNLRAGKVSEPTFVAAVVRSLDSWEYQSRIFAILPPVQKLELSERNISLYAGDSAPVVIRGTAAPSEIWLRLENGESNIVWASGKPEILSVTDNGDQTATIEALGAGNTNIILKDTVSGRQATAGVTILQPVTGLSISGPDTIAAGSGAGYKAVLEPQNAGNKKVQWSIDADREIATVQQNGQLKVTKGTPSGTVILLTCTAEGSASPRVVTKTITVE